MNGPPNLARLEARADNLIDFQDNLRDGLIRLRRAQGLSQDTVAERMGVKQPTVANFERYDANPTFSTVRRYAMAVGARLKVEVIDDNQEKPRIEIPSTRKDTLGQVQNWVPVDA